MKPSHGRFYVPLTVALTILTALFLCLAWGSTVFAKPLLLRQETLSSKPTSRDGSLLERAQAELQGGNFVGAQRLLESLVEDDPSSIAGWMLLAAAYAQLSQADLARQSYSRVLTLDPDAPGALYNLGILEMRNENYEDAAEHLSRLRQLQPDDEQILAPLIHCLLTLKRKDEAIGVVKDSLRQLQEDSDYSIQIGKVLLRHELFKEAEPFLRRAHASALESYEARVLLSLIESRLGHPEEVIDLLHGITISSPLHARLLGEALVELIRIEEAIDVWREAIRLWKEKQFFMLMVDSLERQSRAIEMTGFLEEAHNRWPEDSEIRSKLVGQYFRAGRASDVIELIRSAPSENLSASELEMLTQCYISLKNWKEVEETARAALERPEAGEESYIVLANIQQLRGEDPDVVRLFEEHSVEFASSSRFQFTLAMSYYNMGKFEKARQVLNVVIQLDPDFPQAHFVMGHSFSSSGQREDALPYYEKAMQLDPENSLYRFQLGLILYELGQKEEARSHLERSVALNESHAPALFQLATIYFEASRLEEARTLLERAIKVNPGFESPYYLLSQVYAKLGDKEKSREMMQEFKRVQQEIRDTMKEMKAQDSPRKKQ